MVIFAPQQFYIIKYNNNSSDMGIIGGKHTKCCSVFFIGLILLQTIFSLTSLSDENDDSILYGFAINVTPDQTYSVQSEIVKLINELLHENIKVYWLSSDASLSVQDIKGEKTIAKQSFNKGSYIIKTSDDSYLNSKAIFLTYKYSMTKEIETHKIMQPASNIEAYELKEPRIAHYDCESIYPSYYRLLNQSGFINQKILKPDELISELNNDNYDIVIWGGGNNDPKISSNDLLSLTGLQVRSKIRNFVKNGGGYIGSCYGSHVAASGYKRPIGYPLELSYFKLLQFLPIQLKLIDRPIYRALPGGGAISVRVTNPNHPIAYGLPEIIEKCPYAGGPMFLNKILGRSKAETIGIIEDVDVENWNWDVLMNINLMWNNPLLTNETKISIAKKWIERSKGEDIWVTSEFGQGKVVAFGDHPEASSVRDQLINYVSPPRIIYNTIYYITSTGPHTVSLDKSISHSKIKVDAGDKYAGLIDTPIQFYGKAEGEASIHQWYWVFKLPYRYYYEDDVEDTIEQQNATFAYDELGEYNVTLFVVDNKGNIGYDIAEIEILSHYTDLYVEIEIPIAIDVDKELEFDCCIKDGLPPYKYHWKFGDGEESFEETPIHTYKKPGFYTVSLEIEDQYGESKIDKKSIDVIDDSGRFNPTVSSLSTLAVVVILILILITFFIFYLKRRNQT